MCAYEFRCPWCLEEGVRSPGSAVTGSWGYIMEVLRTGLRSSTAAARTLNCWDPPEPIKRPQVTSPCLMINLYTFSVCYVHYLYTFTVCYVHYLYTFTVCLLCSLCLSSPPSGIGFSMCVAHKLTKGFHPQSFLSMIFRVLKHGLGCTNRTFTEWSVQLFPLN